MSRIITREEKIHKLPSTPFSNGSNRDWSASRSTISSSNNYSSRYQQRSSYWHLGSATAPDNRPFMQQYHGGRRVGNTQFIVPSHW
eukprot:UN12766